MAIMRNLGWSFSAKGHSVLEVMCGREIPYMHGIHVNISSSLYTQVYLL